MPAAVRPLKLPDVVLICSDPAVDCADDVLAQAINQTNPTYGRFDFYQPIFDAVSVMFWSEFGYVERKTLQSSLPFSGGQSKDIRDLCRSYEIGLEQCLGEDFLAKTYINRAQNGQIEDSEIIFTYVDPTKVKPLLEFFGPTNCLFIMIGKLREVVTMKSEQPKFVWLPMPSISERMAMLRRELGEL